MLNKNLVPVISLLEEEERYYTQTSNNKILIEEGYIIANKDNTFNIKIISDEYYNNCDLEETLDILLSYS